MDRQLRLGDEDRLAIGLRHEANVRHVRRLAEAAPVTILALLKEFFRVV
jgi:hypothetical protein